MPLVLRLTKGSPLTNAEVDGNFTFLNDGLSLKAPLESPTLTGTPAAPTAAVNTNTTQIATTAFVVAQIADDAPTKTGSGASGTWGISISGNAATATNIAGGSAGTIPYQSDAGTTTLLAAGTSGQILQSNGAAAPSWVSTTSIDAGSVDGKSFGTFTAAGGILYATSTTAAAAIGAGTAGQYLKSNGASAPTWADPGVSASNDTTTDASYYPALFTTTSGIQTSAKVSNTKLYFNPSTGTLNATTFAGSGSGITSLGTSTGYQIGSLGVGTIASETSGEIRATDNITAFYSSDIKFKENVKPIENALDKVFAIGGKTFDWSDEYISTHGGEDGYFIRKNDFGVIAQDVQKVFPQAVRVRPDGSLAVDYEKLSALAFAAICDIKIQMDELKQKY